MNFQKQSETVVAWLAAAASSALTYYSQDLAAAIIPTCLILAGSRLVRQESVQEAKPEGG